MFRKGGRCTWCPCAQVSESTSQRLQFIFITVRVSLQLQAASNREGQWSAGFHSERNCKQESGFFLQLYRALVSLEYHIQSYPYPKKDILALEGSEELPSWSMGGRPDVWGEIEAVGLGRPGELENTSMKHSIFNGLDRPDRKEDPTSGSGYSMGHLGLDPGGVSSARERWTFRVLHHRQLLRPSH